ncbi:hypothetical protein DN752_21465 [Echinicola strongylocentroti]|uniref:Uncharacterized protein n=1 Tax=Echinicola strongylocentroti TaxID=1795355 RepID=A0A2Z4IN20_9BACT|nr:hypothetical protein DN752_21465 [Echinicola strongylocentroti]
MLPMAKVATPFQGFFYTLGFSSISKKISANHHHPRNQRAIQITSNPQLLHLIYNQAIHHNEMGFQNILFTLYLHFTHH